MVERLKELQQVLTRPDTVLFVGSGVSCWSGLPTWPALLEKLAEYLEGQDLPTHLIRREINQGDLLQAASYGFYPLSQTARSQFIRTACTKDQPQPSDLHKAITRLRPSCFITTNYDKLLETALQKWRPDKNFRVIGNWDSVDAASALQAAAVDFIFKPHGDMDTAGSIIITREDYRSLHGKRRFVFDAMKTLLATRPVVFLGFGLRDPDFLLMKDLLAETYPGGLSDHYAIVADADTDEIPYWKDTYGVHLISYQTSSREENRHRRLVELIERLAEGAEFGVAEDCLDAHSSVPGDVLQQPENVLMLVRHCARMQLLGSEVNDPLPLRISYRDFDVSNRIESALRFFGGPAVPVLLKTNEQILLTGPPGAGKSYTLREVARVRAQRSQAALIDGLTPDLVPIYVELKSYSGSLWDLIQTGLPVGLALDNLVKAKIVLFLLDGANEIETRHFESGQFAADLAQFSQRVGTTPMIISSRSDVGLGQNRLVECSLDEVEIEYVETRFASHNRELIRLLQKPLFLRLALTLPKEGIVGYFPQDLYLAYFKAIETSHKAEFNCSMDILDILAPIAFELVDDGRQTFTSDALNTHLRQKLNAGTGPIEFTNWLVEQEVLIPLPGGRISFSHHSLSEYLAAYQLSQLYVATPDIIRQCLSRRSWDSAILLTLGFLSSSESDILFKQILRTDPIAALRALDYIEVGRSALLSSSLLYIGELDTISDQNRSELASALQQIHADEGCREALWQLCKKGGILGGGASAPLAELDSATDRKTDIYNLVDLTFELDDYNFSSSVGYAIHSFADPEMIRGFFEKVRAVDLSDTFIKSIRSGDSNEEYQAIIVLGENILKHYSVSEIQSMAGLQWNSNPLVQAIILSALHGNATLDALRISSQLLLSGNVSAVIALYFQVEYGEPTSDDLDAVYAPELLACIYKAIGAKAYVSSWSLQVLQSLCDKSAEWKLSALAHPYTDNPLLKALIQGAAGEREEVMLYLTTWAKVGECSSSEAQLIGTIDSWNDHEELLISLLKARNSELGYALLDRLYGFDTINYKIGADEIAWWLDWLCDPLSLGLDLFPDRLGTFIASHMTKDAIPCILSRFDEGDEAMRQVIAENILIHEGIVTLRDYNDDALSWLVASLSNQQVDPWIGHPLGVVATEEFAKSVLIPLMSNNPGALLRQNLHIVLQECGRRHGKRYVTIEDEAIG